MRCRFPVVIMLMAILMAFGSVDALAQKARSARVAQAIKEAKAAEKAAKKGKIKTSEAESDKADAEKASTYVQKLGVLGKRYLFGVATSYADSVTMITMVSEVDSMTYDLTTKTPLGLDLYTTSFRNYLEGQGRTGYICSTFVCESDEEAERKLTAICNRVNKKKRTHLESVDGFLYHHIATEYIYTNVGEKEYE